MDRAFLVGINKYPGAPLSGCVNDVMDMAKYLVAAHKFDPKAVRLLVDGRATTKAIKDRLQWLVTGLKAGDRIFFQYSGHGAQVPTRSPAGEVDGLDEVICPVDFDWEDPHMIRDKDFNQIFSQIPAGVTALWVSDSCHSGDLEKGANGLGGRKERRLLPPEDIAWRMEAVNHHQLKALPKALPNIALISGCQSDQTSADAHFGNRYNGALTYYLLDALKTGIATPMPTLINTIRASLKAHGFDQVPQLEGPSSVTAKPFLQP